MARAEDASRKVAPRFEAPAFDDGDCYTVEEFCRRHRISIQLFYKFKNEMPEVFRVGKRVLITRESAARWRAQRAEATTDA